MGMRLTRAWSIHMPMLLKYVQQTDGPILEMGAGIFSTPLLHWLALKDYRKLVSLESSKEYYDFAKNYETSDHIIQFVKDWDNVNLNEHWSVALIDHDTNRRAIDAIR